MKLFVCLITLSLVCLVTSDEIEGDETLEITGNPENVEDFVFKGKEAVIKGPRLQIANGQQASNTQFPYVAELKINTATGGFLCTGSLIGRNWILTARHCIADKVPTSILALLGAADRNAVRTQIYVNSVSYITPTDGSAAPDIALFRLASSAPTFDTIKTIRIPKLCKLNFEYENYDFTAIGWGMTSANVFSRYLQYTTFRTLPKTSCNMQTLAPSLGPYVMCSQPPTGTSQLLGGDSGGPGVIVEDDGKETLIGVNVAYVTTSANVVYQASTRVSNYLPWILLKTGIFYL